MSLHPLGFTLPLAPEHGARVLIAALRLLGGKGSGHFGHAGRPGEVGGSTGGSDGERERLPRLRDRVKDTKHREVAPLENELKLFHSSSSESIPSFDAFFGGQEFVSTFSPTEFGEFRSEATLPKGTRVLDLNKNTALAREFKAEIAKLAWPDDADFHKRLAEGDPSVEDDFYEAWTNKDNIVAALKNRYGSQPNVVARYQDEYLIPKNIVMRIPVQRIKALGGPGSGHFGHAGRPGEVGGSAPSGRSPSGSILDEMLNEIVAKEKADEKTAIVRRRSDDIAEQMGVPPSIINVVNKEPRAFVVGNQNFKEAGHYNPTTGMIEINARNSYDERMSVTQGIVAHEISHALYDAAKRASEAEHKEIHNLPAEEYDRLYRASGYVREETQAEVHERWPVSAMFYRHLGDSYMETESEQGPGESRYGMKARRLEEEDGVSAYSRSYWQPELIKAMGGFQRALDETLAETTRRQVVPISWNEKPAIPHKLWRAFAEDLQEVAKLPKVKAHLGGNALSRIFKV